MSFDTSIEKEELEEMEIGAFEGEVKIVFKEADVKKAVATLTRHKVLGFDTETRPAFKKGQYFKTALLQLSTPKKAYIFQLQKMQEFDGLASIINNRKILKVGAAIRDDVKKLNSYFPAKRNSFIELQTMVKEYGIEDISLRKMTAIVLGFRISKSQQTSNWEADPLDEAQVRYAATDAWVALRIYQELKKND